MHNLRLQSGRNGEMVVYDGSNELFASAWVPQLSSALIGESGV
jgi:hypothetical protein